MALNLSNSEDGELNPETTKYLMNTYGVSYGDAPTLAQLYKTLQTMNTDYAGDGGGQIGVTEQRMDEILRQVAPQLGAVSAQEAFTSALNPAEKQQFDYIKQFTEQQGSDIFTFAPLLGMAAVGGLAAGAFPGIGGAEALGGAASALPESYWSMLADAGGAGVPSAAAGTVGSGLSAADIAGLTQMGQAAGLSGDALASFVAQGGSAAGVGGGFGNTIGSMLQPNPSSAVSAAQNLGGGGGMANGDGFGGLGTDGTTPGYNPDEFTGASGGYGNVGGSAWSNLLNAFGGNGNLMGLGSLASGLLGAGAATSAANTQAAAADRATAAQLGMFNTINQQQAPWRQAGQNALSTIGANQDYFNHQFNANDLNANLAPNWQFQRDQGLMATNNALNLQSGWSGNTLRGINDYAQNFAGNAYQQAYNNYTNNQSNIFNRLASIAGLGQQANSSTGTAGTAAAGQAGNSMMAGGAAQAAGTVGASNAISGGINNALGWYSLPSILNGSYA